MVKLQKLSQSPLLWRDNDYGTDAALINQAAATAVQAAGVYASGEMNKRTLRWNEKMYERQKADSLEAWNRQNEYNSPTAQMARLREAGLNPNLVYGKGADNTAMAINRPQAMPWNPKPPDVSGLANSLFAGADLAMKQAQTDLVRKQMTVLDQDMMLKSAQTAQTLQNTAKTQQQYEQAQSLFPYDLQGKQLDMQAKAQGISIREQENARAAALNTSNLKEALIRMGNLELQGVTSRMEQERLRKTIEAIEKDNTIRDYEIDLNRKGVQKTDTFFWRQMIELWNRFKSGVKEGIEERYIPPIFRDKSK